MASHVFFDRSRKDRFQVLPGGRIKKFRARPRAHNCRRRRAGRPALSWGCCYSPQRPARVHRRRCAAALRNALRSGSEHPDFLDLLVPRPNARLYWG